MKKTIDVTRIFALIFAFVMAFSSVCTYAPIKAEAATLSQQKANIENKIKQSEAELAKLKKEKASEAAIAQKLESQLADLTSKVSVIQDEKDGIDAQVTTLTNDISSLTTQIAQTEDELVEMNDNIDETVELFCQRMRANYMSGSSSFFEIFLQTGDISSLLNRLEMFKRVTDNDQKLVTQLEGEIEKAEELKTQLTEKKESSEIKKTELTAKKVELDASIAEYDDILVEIEGKVAEHRTIIAKMNGKIAEAEDEVAAYKDDQAAIEAAIKKAQQQQQQQSSGNQGSSGNHGSASGTISSSGWMWPVPTSSSYISSVYGWRRDPISGQSKFHYGIDIAAPKDSKIVAPKDGTVVYTKYSNSGYGIHMLVNHNNGYYTLYGHCNSLAVSSGQSVKQGQVIAYVGTTGYSTGYHLHFEVRDGNGNKLNPSNFVRK
ncbi:MAG: peptidoglycan DD-metalloendopeptidase family protein [Clostridia bacterium]|nr:peptidoglycan DD-metalloendopeptidase family protein [Clostridia bacterium]